MARDPRSRDELYRRLAEVLGADATDTLMEALPPHHWDELATKDDLARLDQRLDQRLDHMEARWTARLEATEYKIVAAFRGELNAAITSQTRSIMFSLLGGMLGTGSLVLAAARLG
jgi:hypothetical protein